MTFRNFAKLIEQLENVSLPSESAGGGWDESCWDVDFIWDGGANRKLLLFNEAVKVLERV